MANILSWILAGLPSVCLAGLSVYFAVTVDPWWTAGLIGAGVLCPYPESRKADIDRHIEDIDDE